MIDLDTSLMPPRVVTALMLRGAQLPPLQWNTHPLRAAKTALDEISDDRLLLACEEFLNQGMAPIVRALLYFWNGYPAEARMFAQAGPERECAYVEALCARQEGNPVESKTLFQLVDTYPTFGPLAAYAADAIGLSVTAVLKRLRDVIAFCEQWEPHAFADVYEMAREGELDPKGEEVVRSLQCREFELLLAHCLEEATGGKVTRTRHGQAQALRRAPPKRPKAPPRRPVAQKKTPAKQPGDAAPTKVNVICPKCQEAVVVAADKRGAMAKCANCGVVFLIPAQTGQKAVQKK